MNRKLNYPTGRQREVLYLPSQGHSVVLGSAGSGKTTLAIYRAIYLTKSSLPHSGKTLLLTFNNALVHFLSYLKPQFRILQIETYHKFARGYLGGKGKMGKYCILDSSMRENYISEAVKGIKSECGPSSFFQNHKEFFSKEIQWILSNGIDSIEKYTEGDVIGNMNHPLPLEHRKLMYKILERYLQIRTQRKYLYDWDDLAFHVRKEFECDNTDRVYKHIVIDEGQDFTPEMIRSLAAAIPNDGSLTFFGDFAQQVYGQRMNWRSAGFNVENEDIWYFKENYRNTKQIAQLALAISNMPYFKEIVDLVEPTLPIADGAPPTLVKCKNEEDQVEITLKSAISMGKTQKVAILFKDRKMERKFPKDNSNFRLDKKTRIFDKPGIYYGTYHAAKGLEFDVVFLPFLDEKNFPDQNSINSLGKDDANTHSGKLLYVAVTRAKTDLFLLYEDTLTHLLPRNKSLFQVVTR